MARVTTGRSSVARMQTPRAQAMTRRERNLRTARFPFPLLNLTSFFLRAQTQGPLRDRRNKTAHCASAQRR